MGDPRLLYPPPELWRVGRTPEPLNFSEINPSDAQNRVGGNRFDVPGGSLLYAATRAEGAFAETLARFRPTAAIRALPREADEHFMAPGAVPADWRTRRQIVSFGLLDPLPFVDVDHPATHSHLVAQIPSRLRSLGYETLDAATLRGKDRFLTRAIAEWLYSCVDDDGNYLYSGIRYGSRLGEYECWAIFDGAIIEQVSVAAIDRSDARLLRVARDFDLSIH